MQILVWPIMFASSLLVYVLFCWILLLKYKETVELRQVKRQVGTWKCSHKRLVINSCYGFMF